MAKMRQDEENGKDAARPSLPPQRQVTKHVMEKGLLHEQMLRNPPTVLITPNSCQCLIPGRGVVTYRPSVIY